MRIVMDIEEVCKVLTEHLKGKGFAVYLTGDVAAFVWRDGDDSTIELNVCEVDIAVKEAADAE